VFVADVDAPELDDGDRHHLQRVLRLRPGDPLTVSDGAGRWRPARFGAAVDVDGPVVECAPSTVLITICFALVKGERPELVVQKLTELGVDRIVPFVAARSVVRWEPDKAAREAVRLRAVARSAAMQSRRCWLPVVDEVADYVKVSRGPGVARADRDGDPPDLARPTVLVGPEGGWSDEERAVPLPIVGLGDHVLRAETAAITAAVLLAALRSGWVAPPG
jgi:16S rRNA (uracil1498-N3)-methyltransferase